VPSPRYIEPNATYAICRRIEGRRVLLRPDSKLTALFIYLLALCAAKFGVTLHMATVMSTHFHLVVTVPNGNVSEFMHALDTHLACAIQVFRKYKYGSGWAVLNGSGRVPHPHPLGRSADDFDFLIFSQTTFPAMLPSAEWDIGRVLN